MEKHVKKQEIRGGANAGELCSRLANMSISNRFSQENITKIKLGKKT
jgi:hypothetical protein